MAGAREGFAGDDRWGAHEQSAFDLGLMEEKPK
jgi:hypothetical protein